MSVDTTLPPTQQQTLQAHKQIQMAVAGAMIVAVSYGWGRYNYGLFLPEIKSAFSLSPAWLGLIGSLSYTGYLLTTLFSSLLATLLGPRILITVGGLCAAGGLLLVSQAETATTLLFGLVLAGISPGLCYTPLSDVVVRSYTKNHQSRAYAFMNTGTGFGVILAGPLALWMGDQWRAAWLLFAGLSLLITLYNGYLMPGRCKRTTSLSQGLPPLTWLLNRQRLRLYLYACSVGLASSVYWTFSVDIITENNQVSGFMGMDTQFGTRVFWILLGAAGCLGVIAGDLVRKTGIITAIRSMSLLLCGSMLCLAIAPGNGALALFSAVLFGSSFVILTAFAGIWAVHSFHQRPSAGFGLVFLIMSLGQFIGPFTAGLVAELSGLSAAFYFGSGLSALLILITPKDDIRHLTPD